MVRAGNMGSGSTQIWVGLLHVNWSWNQGSVSQLSHEAKFRYLVSWQRDVQTPAQSEEIND